MGINCEGNILTIPDFADVGFVHSGLQFQLGGNKGDAELRRYRRSRRRTALGPLAHVSVDGRHVPVERRDNLRAREIVPGQGDLGLGRFNLGGGNSDIAGVTNHGQVVLRRLVLAVGVLVGVFGAAQSRLAEGASREKGLILPQSGLGQTEVALVLGQLRPGLLDQLGVATSFW